MKTSIASVIFGTIVLISQLASGQTLAPRPQLSDAAKACFQDLRTELQAAGHAVRACADDVLTQNGIDVRTMTRDQIKTALQNLSEQAKADMKACKDLLPDRQELKAKMDACRAL